MQREKSLQNIDIGTKVACFFAEPLFLPSNRQEEFRRECLQFYVNAVSYLQKQLPFENSFLKYVQYIHPAKRLDPESTSAISNIALSVARVMKNCLPTVFDVCNSETVEGVCDLVRSQWKLYQTDIIKEEWYTNVSEPKESSSRVQFSYWQYALQICMIEPTPSILETECKIDEFWQKVGSIKEKDGSSRYPQLFALIKCVLSLSHGNAVPERGFSVNKIMLESHGYTIDNDTIAALRLVKDSIKREGGVENFPITRKLIKYSSESNREYKNYLASKKAKEEEDKAVKLQKESKVAAIEVKKQKLKMITDDIDDCHLQIKAADDIVADANKALRVALDPAKKTLNRIEIKAAQTKIDLGIGQKRQLEELLDKLKSKGAKIDKA